MTAPPGRVRPRVEQAGRGVGIARAGPAGGAQEPKAFQLRSMAATAGVIRVAESPSGEPLVWMPTAVRTPPLYCQMGELRRS